MLNYSGTVEHKPKGVEMKTIKYFMAAVLMVMIAGCGPASALRNVADMTDSMNRISSNAGGSGSEGSAVYGGGSGDVHYIQADDYFISENSFDSGWMRVEIAKMIQTPAAETRNEGKFMVVLDAREVWTSDYWRTRPAQSSDIKLGAVVIAFDWEEGGAYVRPQNQEMARTNNWFMAKITDTSTLYQNVVMVSGGYRVKTDNLRVVE